MDIPASSLAFCALISVAALQAQPVRAPKAQALIDSVLKEHPEIQTIGLHVTPPGQPDNVNIACSKPGKVGKRSAPIDMEVMATGKASLRMASKGAFDIGVPIGDAAGRKLGMIVVVIPANRAADAADAMRQVLAIRDELQSRIADVDALFVGATVVSSPMVMVGQTPLPELRGDFARLAADVAGDRLFAVANENNSTEVFNLAGEHLKSEPGVAIPPRLALNGGSSANDSLHGRRFEANSSGEIRVVDETTGKQVALLEGAGEIGDITFDAAGRRVFVTGRNGIVVFRQDDADHYRTISRFGTMGGIRSIYLPSKKLFYVLHGKNLEDGAGLQVYEVKD
jgi:hypothetical protein